MGFFEELQKATDIQYILITDYIAQLAKEQDSGIEATINYLLRSSLKNAYEKQPYGNYIVPYYDLDEGSPLFNTLMELKEFFKKQVSIFAVHSVKDELELFNKISIGNLYLKKSELPIIRPTINKVSKAPPPPNHIKASSPFKQKTIGDLTKTEKSKEGTLPNRFQQMTMLYDYFTPHQACCFIAGLHPNFNGRDDDLEIAEAIIEGGFKSGKLIADDDQQIKSGNLKLFLYSKNWIVKGFNDNLINDTGNIDQSSQQLKEAQNKIAELENELLQVQEAKPKVAVIPFGKRLDFISKDLPQSERIKRSYELCSDNISFYEDTHPVNTPDEMIKRIQGLLTVIKRKDSKIVELERHLESLSKSPKEQEPLNERTENSYKTTIGLLLELMVTPKGIEHKQPFSSQAVIINEIIDKKIYGQGKSALVMLILF